MQLIKTLVIALAVSLVSPISQATKTAHVNDPLWRTLSPENTLYMQTTAGQVIFELAHQFSPNHVKHIKKLVRSGFYDGLSFYRVIDGFVIQGGDVDEKSNNPLAKQTMKAEFEQVITATDHYTLVQSPDLLAEQTGFINGFAVGRDSKDNKQWLITCPGVVNLARSNDINSGTTDFAIMIGQAPRHLDRNMSIFGRVISGMEQLNLIKRGSAANGGMIKELNQRSKIISMHIGADLVKEQQQIIKIERTDSQAFKQKIAVRRKRSNDFYRHKGNGALDICYLKVGVQLGSR